MLSVSSGLAATGFLGLTEDEQHEIHAQLHPGCNSDCRFNDLWKKAWSSLSMTDSVEWEIDDPVLRKLLRLNLARPPTAKNVENDRRRRYALLTITDITKHRREYQSLVKRERALMRLLREQGVDTEDSANDDGLIQPIGEMRLPSDYGQAFRSLNRQTILAQELERKRIAADLHDSLAQSAGVIKYAIEASAEQISRSAPDLDLSLLEGAIDQTKALVEEIRRISGNLAPSMLDDFGLCVALQGLCSEFRAEGCELRPACEACVDESELPDIVKFAVYRVVQEALNNIAKHSSASRAGVVVYMTNGELQLEICDDGVGYDLAAARGTDKAGGFGLGSMRDRVVATSGEFSIESAPGKGVMIRATWTQEGLDLLSNEAVLDGVDGHG